MTDARWSEHVQAVGRVASALEDELAEDADARRYDEIQVLGGELRAEIGNLVREVRTAAEPLGALDATDAVLGAARSVLSQADAPGVLAALDVERDVADLAILHARLRVAERLHDAAVRETAQAVGVTPGYISELRRVKKGLPSADIADRLDHHIPPPAGSPTLREIVTEANAERGTLADQRRGRRGGTTVAGMQIPADLRGQDRLNALADALRLDESVQQAVERLLSLPDRERRAVARLINELARV